MRRRNLYRSDEMAYLFGIFTPTEGTVCLSLPGMNLDICCINGHLNPMHQEGKICTVGIFTVTMDVSGNKHSLLAHSCIWPSSLAWPSEYELSQHSPCETDSPFVLSWKLRAEESTVTQHLPPTRFTTGHFHILILLSCTTTLLTTSAGRWPSCQLILVSRV